MVTTNGRQRWKVKTLLLQSCACVSFTWQMVKARVIRLRVSLNVSSQRESGKNTQGVHPHVFRRWWVGWGRVKIPPFVHNSIMHGWGQGYKGNFLFRPRRVSPFSRVLIFTRARVSLALLSLRKNEGLLVVYKISKTTTLSFQLCILHDYNVMPNFTRYRQHEHTSTNFSSLF